MSSLRRTFHCAATAGLLVSLVTAGRAELSPTSPFLPPQSQIAAGPVAPPPLELRGVTTIENVTMFSIFDPSAKKTGGWVKLNEQSQGFTVKNYDAGADTVTVDYQGRSLRLVMRTPKIASSGPSVAVPPMAVPLVAQSSIVPNASPRPVVPNPPPATEAARMAEWSAEIQKRRDLRNQQTGTTPTPPPSATPAAVPAAAGQVRPLAPSARPGP